MTEHTVVKAEVSEDLVNEVEGILAACGLTISDAIRLMLMHTVEDGALPFSHIIPTEETIAAMRDSLEGRTRSFTSVEELMADLHADD